MYLIKHENHTENDLTFVDGLFVHLKKKVVDRDLLHVRGILVEEEYDSEALQEDVTIDCNEQTSNIANLCNNYTLNLIQDYLYDQTCM